MRGLLIAVEGLDKSGKTTHIAKLVDRLDNVQLIKFPCRETKIGMTINEYLQERTHLDSRCAHLLFSANRWELAEKIKSLLLDGITVILDRYVYSGIAYSVSNGIPFDWCITSDIGLPKPDYVIYITRDAKFDGEERYEHAQFQQLVADCFNKMISPDWIIVDNNRPFDDVHEELYNHIKRFMNNRDDTTTCKMHLIHPSLFLK